MTAAARFPTGRTAPILGHPTAQARSPEALNRRFADAGEDALGSGLITL